MPIDTFRDMYLAELEELHSAEQQLCAELPRLAASARHHELKGIFNALLAETRSHVERVALIVQTHQRDFRKHTDQSMQALLQETEKWKGMLRNPNVEDAGLIASAQRVLHYGIAAYGTAAAYAGMLKLPHDQTYLHAILEAKKAGDRRLTDLAKDIVNQDAVAA
jgi:ferritin-like metal-binding protein YciE